jgi:hypothetical protein
MALRTECTDCGGLVGTGAPARRVLFRPVAIWALRRLLQKGDKGAMDRYQNHQETQEDKRKYGVQ